MLSLRLILTNKGRVCDRVGVLWIPREACPDRNDGDVEKDAALDEEKGEIIIVELRSVHQFNDSIDNIVMHAVPIEQEATIQHRAD